MDWLTSVILAAGLVLATFALAWGFAPKGWRTVVFNGLSFAGTAVGPLLEHLQHVPWHDAFDAPTAVFVILFVNLANILWRAKTTTPLGVRH